MQAPRGAVVTRLVLAAHRLRTTRGCRASRAVRAIPLPARIALVAGAVVGAVAVARIHMIDLAVYRAGAAALLHRRPLYSAHAPGSLLPFTYPPFAALVFAPFALLGRAVAQLLWTAVSLAALARSCWVMAAALRREGPGHPLFVRPAGARWSPAGPVARTALALGAFALATEPVGATLAYGQVNLLLLWLVVEDTLARREARWVGVGVGLAAGLKIVPAGFVLFFLLTGRRRAALVALATAVVTVGVGFALVPEESRLYWTKLAYDPARVGGVDYAGNQSFYGALERLTGGQASKLVWLACAVLVAAVAAFAAHLLVRRNHPVAALGTISAALLCASPISWSHHWVWVVVMAAGCLPFLASWGARLMLATLGLVLTLRVLWWSPHAAHREYAWSGWQHLAGNSYVLTALAYVLFTLRVSLVSPPRPFRRPS